MIDTIQVLGSLEKCLSELCSEDVDSSCKEGTLAAALHGYYNQVGLKAGWLKPEYATPLSEQDEVNKRKNILAAQDVLCYWKVRFEERDEEERSQLVEAMERSVDYEAHRGEVLLEAASNSQHRQWQRFVEEFQKERITPGHPKYRPANHQQYQASYQDLSEEEKDQDRLVVAVITDMVLARAIPEYERRIKV